MFKDFDKWNEKKKLLETSDLKLYFHEGEIWWCSIGINIAKESCGKGHTFRRPILILKKLSPTTFIGIPLSTQPKHGSWFQMVKVFGINRYALLYQIRMFSTNRFQRRMTAVNKDDFIKVRQKLETLLELSHSEQTN